jgi:hypothetical protein
LEDALAAAADFQVQIEKLTSRLADAEKEIRLQGSEKLSLVEKLSVLQVSTKDVIDKSIRLEQENASLAQMLKDRLRGMEESTLTRDTSLSPYDEYPSDSRRSRGIDGASTSAGSSAPGSSSASSSRGQQLGSVLSPSGTKTVRFLCVFFIMVFLFCPFFVLFFSFCLCRCCCSSCTYYKGFFCFLKFPLVSFFLTHTHYIHIYIDIRSLSHPLSLSRRSQGQVDPQLEYLRNITFQFMMGTDSEVRNYVRVFSPSLSIF